MCVAAGVSAREHASLDRAIDDAFARYHLPGIAAGVVEDGEVTWTRTKGELVAGEGRAITRKTLFKIASNSKAMTAATLGRLVDAGKLGWDDPVTKWLPNFRMHDDWVTREFRVRDLLIHDSGLREGAGDLLLWPEPNEYTRADVIAGLRHLVPVSSFRARYDYDNSMYILAGEVAAAVAREPYERVVAREVFAPLGLERCRVGAWDVAGVGGDLAQPHRLVDDRPVAWHRDEVRVPRTTMDPAGGIRCSLDDMLRWMLAWLDPQPGWLSDAQRAEAWKPQIPMPVGQRSRDWDDTHFRAYGFGWRLADVDGSFQVSHTGTLSGMYSLTVVLPQHDAGFVVLMNGDAATARVVLAELMTKHWTKPSDERDVAYWDGRIAAEPAPPVESRVPDTSDRVPATAAMLGDALGLYEDPLLGDATLCASGDSVRFAVRRSPRLAGKVMRSRDRFLVDWDDDAVDLEAWIDPKPASGDSPAKLAMSKVDPEGDFSSDYEDLAFARVRACDSPATTPAQAGLVDVRSLAPTIMLDLRYATGHNFVGARIDGYDAPRCMLLKPAAEALARVERRLRKSGLGLRVFDCYRPTRAVRHFLRWAKDPDDVRTKAEFYPALDKSVLVPDYIASSSGHSRGATVDLTLVRCAGDSCEPIDMGTPFDLFDPRANTASPAITPEQRKNRERLVAAMRREGFANYAMEWWHYTLKPEPSPETYFDVPIR
ncbi:MAG TPA: serine hydrolase [Xanthomonadales bacterium]|nr:serine hydrolase [Xanthomonadales bacterium]